MEKEKHILKSMTDRVIELSKIKKYEHSESSWLWDHVYQVEKTEKYANFLKQPLALGMFVPTDKDGNILEEPTHLEKMQAGWMDNPIDDNFYRVKEFKSAQERVLFKGFTYHKFESDDFNPEYVFVRDAFQKIGLFEIEAMKVEDLLTNKKPIELTESGAREAGLI